MRWVLLGLVSLVFCVITGGTFSSLGVLLPAMIEELGWSWTQAGLGFTVVALFTGLSSTLPAFTIGRFGLRATYLIGGLTIATGFFILSITQNAVHYMVGAALIGLGYSQAGAVPAVKLLSSWFTKRRSLVIGIFFTAGAVGSICGPLIASYAIATWGSWRIHWLGLAVLTAILTLLTVIFVQQKSEAGDGDIATKGATSADAESWPFRDVLRNRQYYIIVLSVTVTLLGALTMSTWQVSHMLQLGVAATVTASALSMHALFNAASRISGGLVIDKMGAKRLFAIGLASGVVGMGALSVANNNVLILIFAIGDGISFGIVTFSSSILLLEYYGQKNNPMILGFLNLVTTFAMVGPVLAGYVADQLGGFFEIFIFIAILMLVAFLLTLTMSKPTRDISPNRAPI